MEELINIINKASNEYYVDDKTYDGNSLVEEGDVSKIGTTIQILYLDWLPWFNRPIYYWDD